MPAFRWEKCDAYAGDWNLFQGDDRVNLHWVEPVKKNAHQHHDIATYPQHGYLAYANGLTHCATLAEAKALVIAMYLLNEGN